MSAPTLRLGEQLVQAGLATSAQVEQALKAQRGTRGRLGYHLVRVAGVNPGDLAEYISAHLAELGGPPAASPEVRSRLPARVALVHNAYPLALEGNRLELAVPPHFGADVVEAVAAATGLLVEPRILPAGLLRQAVERDYIGGAAPGLLEPAAGLRGIVVDEPLRGLKPVAPSLRTADLSAEAWLRSVLGEAVARGIRFIELVPGPGEGRLRQGDEEGAVHSLERHEAVALLVNQLAGCRTPEGEGLELGSFLAVLRGRQALVSVAARRTAHGTRFRLVLADQRLESDDLDELCDRHPQVMDGIEEVVRAGRGGLVLACSPAGGGGRRLLELLGSRLSEVVEGAARVSDLVRPSGDWDEVRAAAGDAATAAEIQACWGRPLLLIDELPGPRAAERALLAASRGLVVAGLAAPDAPGALAWLCRQGHGGALKTGLLRALLEVLAQDEACTCARSGAPSAALIARWAIANAPARVQRNPGCPKCVELPLRRPRALLAWIGTAELSTEELIVDDLPATRARWRAAGRASVVQQALWRAAGQGGELGGVERLLASG